MLRKLIVSLLAVAALVGVVASPASAGTPFGPVSSFYANDAYSAHNAGATFTGQDIIYAGIVFEDRAIQLQAAASGGTQWGGPRVAKAQANYQFCWYLINPQTVTATYRIDVLWDGVVLTTADVDLFPFSHAAYAPWHVSKICTQALAPGDAEQVQVRAKMLVGAPGNVSGTYATTIQAATYP